MVKKVFEEFKFDYCPICGKRADWTGSEVDKESYCDNYICDNCGKHYSIIFDMSYVCHMVEE